MVIQTDPLLKTETTYDTPGVARKWYYYPTMRWTLALFLSCLLVFLACWLVSSIFGMMFIVGGRREQRYKDYGLIGSICMLVTFALMMAAGWMMRHFG